MHACVLCRAAEACSTYAQWLPQFQFQLQLQWGVTQRGWGEKARSVGCALTRWDGVGWHSPHAGFFTCLYSAECLPQLMLSADECWSTEKHTGKVSVVSEASNFASCNLDRTQKDGRRMRQAGVRGVSLSERQTANKLWLLQKSNNFIFLVRQQDESVSFSPDCQLNPQILHCHILKTDPNDRFSKCLLNRWQTLSLRLFNHASLLAPIAQSRCHTKAQPWDYADTSVLSVWWSRTERPGERNQKQRGPLLRFGVTGRRTAACGDRQSLQGAAEGCEESWGGVALCQERRGVGGKETEGEKIKREGEVQDWNSAKERVKCALPCLRRVTSSCL